MKSGIALRLCLLSLVVFAVGCGPSIPAIIPASGTITLNGKPLSKAEIRFMPMQDGLDGNFVASAVSNDQGEFILKMPGKEDSGCCACLCKVLVVEGPVPDELRKGHEDGSNPGGLRQYQKSLPNRPIPNEYGGISSTPLSFEVSPDNHEFTLELKR